jgi:spore maturation protein CgeB
MRALVEQGLDVVPFDQRTHTRAMRAISHVPLLSWLASGPTKAANRALLKAAQKARPDLVWVDKGFWIEPSTLHFLRAGGAKLVHHCTDCISRPMSWRHYLAFHRIRDGLPSYDVALTTNHYDARFYAARQYANVWLTENGYDRDRFKPAKVDPSVLSVPAHDILLVGHREARTERFIVALIKAGLKVMVYGDQWDEADDQKALKGHVAGRRATDEEYVYLLQRAKIGLCFPSVINRSETVGRSFETVACGAFLLAMRTEEHSKCFAEGTEAEFFDDCFELIKKARFYLSDEERRHAIADAGLQRSLTGGYSWQEIIARDWLRIAASLGFATKESSETGL